MNFHKTIGFLASLLLVLGLGVPDSFAQTEGSISTLTVTGTLAENADLSESKVTVTVAVNVTLNTAPSGNDETRTVTVKVTPTSDDSYTAAATTLTIPVVVPDGETTAAANVERTIVFTINTDPDRDDETIAFNATSPDLDDATEATLTLSDVEVDLPAVDQAIDASGIRVLVAKPGNGEYASVGDRTIKVQLLRKDGLASEFGDYTGIVVALYNRNATAKAADKGADDGDAIRTLTLDDTGGQLGTLAISTLRRDTLAATVAPSGTDDMDRVTYRRRTRDRGYDTLEFEFDVAEGTGGDLERVYARATFTSANSAFIFADNPGATPPALNRLNSFDTSTSIYPENPSAFPEKVGDGNLIKIDRSTPSPGVIGTLTRKIVDKNKIGGTGNAGVGDEIQISGSVNGVFRDHSIKLVIISPQLVGYDDQTPAGFHTDTEANLLTAGITIATTVVAPNSELVGYSTTIPATKIFEDGGKISAKFTVAANQFKRKYTADGPADSKIKKDATFEDDNIIAQVQAKVMDKAGNAIAQTTTSATFVLDSRPPKVTLAYPDSSHQRFTTKNSQPYTFLGDSNVELDLKALNVEIDEDHEGGYIFIGGGAVATNDTLHFAASGDNILTSGTDVDLSTLTKNPKMSNGKNNAKAPHQEKVHNKGKAVKLMVVARDLSGNSGSASPVAGTSGAAGTAIYDNLAPVIQRLFPNNADLAKTKAGQKIGGGSEDPVFRVNEAVDSILVRYQADDGTKIDLGRNSAPVGQNIRFEFTDKLVQDEVYSLQVYARDLSGQVGLSGEKAAAETGLTFDTGLSNPVAGGFKIVSQVNTGTALADRDSVVAGQRMVLNITAFDVAMTENLGKKNEKLRAAVTYANAVTIAAMGANGNMLSDVSFAGTGVTDNGDGSAALNGDGWSAGTRSVNIESDKAMGPFSIVVKDMTAGGVVNFSDAKEGLVVGAADIAGFELTAWEIGVTGATTEVWEDFTLRIVPVDAFGNPSGRAFINTADDFAAGNADSLKLLGERYKKAEKDNVVDYDAGAGIDIQLQSFPAIGLPQEVWGLTSEGSNIAARAPASGSLTIQARVVNSSLNENDTRTFNLKEQVILTVQQPLDLSITLLVPGQDGDQAGNTVNIPAGETVTVTARAEGLNEGDTVTFNVGDMETEATADADGYATQSITLSGSGTVTVMASVGQYSESLDIVHEELMGRREAVDANGNPVYLVSLDDNTVDENDIVAFVTAFGTSEGDANYNPQADTDDDGDVDEDDYVNVVSSWGNTAVNGPASKPLVLLPGVNENAELTLSLGSERVVAGELVAVDVSLANVEAVIGYGFKLNYDAAKFEFVSVSPADEDLLKSTGGETLFHHVVSDGQVHVATGMYNGTAVSGGGDVVRFVFRVLYEFEDNARFEIADGLIFDPSQLVNPAVVAGVLELQSTPREFALHQNFPNPFNPDTTIKYDLAESADVTLQIYNVLGQVVRTLVASEVQNAGRYQIRWNGMDERGVPVSSGIYFYQIAADGKFSDVRKLMLLK